MGAQAERLRQPVRGRGSQISTTSHPNSGAAAIRTKSQNQKSKRNEPKIKSLRSKGFEQNSNLKLRKNQNNQIIKKSK